METVLTDELATKFETFLDEFNMASSGRGRRKVTYLTYTRLVQFVHSFGLHRGRAISFTKQKWNDDGRKRRQNLARTMTNIIKQLVGGCERAGCTTPFDCIAGLGNEDFAGLSQFHFAHKAGFERHTLSDWRWRQFKPCEYLSLVVIGDRATMREAFAALWQTRHLCGACHGRSETLHRSNDAVGLF